MTFSHGTCDAAHKYFKSWWAHSHATYVIMNTDQCMCLMDYVQGLCMALTFVSMSLHPLKKGQLKGCYQALCCCCLLNVKNLLHVQYVWVYTRKNRKEKSMPSGVITGASIPRSSQNLYTHYTQFVRRGSKLASSAPCLIEPYPACSEHWQHDF